MKPIYFLRTCCLLLVAYYFLIGCAITAQTHMEQQRKVDFHYKMGISYLNAGDIQMAYVQFQRALQLSPDDSKILNSLGLIYLHLENFKKAEEIFLKAVYEDDRFSDAYNNLGVTHMKTGQWQEAIKSFEKALSNPLYQTPERAFHNLGISYYRIRQFDLAIEAFQNAIKRSPLFPSPHYGLALAYNKAGRFGDAATAIARAIETDPRYRGDRIRFVENARHELLTARGEKAADLSNLLEIMRY